MTLSNATDVGWERLIDGHLVVSFRNGQTPVLDRDVLFLVVGLGLCHGGWDGLAVHTWPGGVGQRQECRSQVCVTGHHVQGLVLWDSRPSDDEGDIDVGFYTQLVT